MIRRRQSPPGQSRPKCKHAAGLTILEIMLLTLSAVCPQGGFRVEYKHLGKAEERSLYDPPTLTILINLDHPLVSAALGDGNVEDTTFRRLSYEIAFSEYAMGLGYEISKQDPNIPADDLLYEVRSTLNRISTAAVALYR